MSVAFSVAAGVAQLLGIALVVLDVRDVRGELAANLETLDQIDRAERSNPLTWHGLAGAEIKADYAIRLHEHMRKRLCDDLRKQRLRMSAGAASVAIGTLLGMAAAIS